MKTRILFVTGGDDFHAVNFENTYYKTPVSDIIDNLSDYEDLDQWELNVLEFDGPIDPKFIEFIQCEIQDYDDSKNKQFYLEGTLLGVE